MCSSDLAMKNPVTVASGTFAPGRTFLDFFDLSELGALTSKGVSIEPWAGNDAPRIAETAGGMLNCIGLQNPGVEGFCATYLKFMRSQGTPLIINVVGHGVQEYPQVIARLEQEEGISAYEVNISCPNVAEGGRTFAEDPAKAAEVTRLCRAETKKPLFLKLTPNVTDIGEIAKAVESEGADAVSLINTVVGMAIDAKRRKPVLSHVVGGLSGPAVKPIALAKVWAVHQAVQIPILGMGGIATGEDAVEFMLAGATAVAVGTASFINPTASVDVIKGIAAFCEAEGVKDVNDLIGALEV